MKVEFELTGEMEQYAPDIQMFVGLMLEKLHKNLHKGRWENLPIAQAEVLLMGEVKELNTALRDESSDAIVREAADVANFAMIIASIQRRDHA